MNWPQKLIEARLLKRYKRFFADIEINSSSKVEVAHVANTGSLKSVILLSSLCPSQNCWITKTDDPNRKLKYNLQAVQTPEGVWVGVNTSWPNKLAKEAFEKGVISHWKKYSEIKAEVKINKETRLDLLLSNSTKLTKKHYVEIKNVTLKKDDAAQFPDGVTERGQKHLRELMHLVDEGNTAEILFTVQRSDCNYFTTADNIDPEYGKLLRQAQKKGVKISAFVVKFDLEQIVLSPQCLEVRI
jgi:sugar fermentation stimulation protein A